MKKNSAERRISRRHRLKTPLRLKIWKSPAPERREESLNLSQHGVYFSTDMPFREGETIEVFFSMPEEITDEPATEWRCTGHVVRVDRPEFDTGKMGIGVRFDCYEVSRVSRP